MQTAQHVVDALVTKGFEAGYSAVDRGLIPDAALRRAVRFLCRTRLREIERGSIAANHEDKMRFVDRDIAIEQAKANEQHYEVSTEFLQSCLGKRMKYSSCLFPPGKDVSLDEAEELMLDLYCQRAKLENGMDILDLGCGWGSLCLYLAESRVYALSNSATQKLHIDATAKEKGLENIQVRTGDVKTYDFESAIRFDRVMSIEMFEHMKNYESLLAKVASWLKPKADSYGGTGALVFIHIFAHRSQPYDFQDGDWMAECVTYSSNPTDPLSNFFSGGTMPSLDLFSYFQRDLSLERSWWLNGKHYAQTLEAWLKLQDKHAKRWLGNKAMVEGKDADARIASVQFYRFRLFFLACAEFFALDDGEQWGVAHYLFSARK